MLYFIFTAVELTAVMPLMSNKITAESLQEAAVSAYFTSANAAIFPGPKFSNSDGILLLFLLIPP